MAIVTPIGLAAQPPVRPGKPRGRLTTLRAWPPMARVGLMLLSLIVLTSLFAPLLAPQDPLAQDIANRLAGPGDGNVLGTDYLGRDLLSRLMYGGRYCLLLAALSVALAVVVGTLIGTLSVMIGGVVQEVTMRAVDFAIAIPELLAALIIVYLLDPSFSAILIAMCVRSWAPYARLSRALTLEIWDKDYVHAARSTGFSQLFIIVRHIVPNIFGPMMAMMCLGFGLALITVGGLSYLGLGIQPPTPDWGAMLAEAQPYMQRIPLLMIAPGAMIFISAMAFTLLGQGLSQVVDPKQRSRS